MSSSNPNTFYKVIRTLENCNIPLENLIRRSLVEPGIAESPFVENFLDGLPRLLGWLAHHERTREVLRKWMKEEYVGTLTSQLRNLTRPDVGLHFNAGTITAERMKDCTVPKIANNIQSQAPELWELVGKLLEADPVIIRRRKKDRAERMKERTKGSRKRAPPMEGLDEDDIELNILEMVNEHEDEPEHIEEILETRERSLLHIVSMSFLLRIGTHISRR